MGVFKHIDIDALPEGWEAAHFRDLTAYALGRTPPRNDVSYWKDGTYPWVSISDMEPYGIVKDTAEKVTEKAFERVFRGQLVPEGSLLMSFKLTIGRIARLGIPALHNEAIISFVPEREKVDDRYLAYYLSQINYSDYQDKAIKGHTLNKGKIDALEIALPPLPEQQRIAQVLSTVQEAIAQQERLIRTTTELKQALMQKLFTEGLRGEALKATEIGMVPESWEVVKLGDLCSLTTGRKDVNEGSPDGPYPFFTCSTEVYRSPVYSFDTEAILVAGNGKVGETKYYSGKFEAYQRTYVLSDFRTHGPFIYQFLKERLSTELNRVVSGSTMPYIRKGDLENVLVPVPSDTEQLQITAQIETVDRKVQIHEQRHAALQDLFRTLLHELMTGKVRVGQGVSLDA
jgi:type I restriction enzyme S subunit